MVVFYSPERLQQYLREADLLLEVRDARAPRATRGVPLLPAPYRTKPRVVLLNKADIADPRLTERWLQHLQQEEAFVVSYARADREARKHLLRVVEDFRARRKRFRKVRLVILGIPNVGKSTVLNTLVGRTVARAGDMPGVTAGPQWIALGEGFLVLDTPGLLTPKRASGRDRLILGAVGCLPPGYVDPEEVALFLLEWVASRYPENWKAICHRFRVSEATPPGERWLADSAHAMRYLRSGGQPDTQRIAEALNLLFRRGAFGRMSVEAPDDRGAG